MAGRTLAPPEPMPGDAIPAAIPDDATPCDHEPIHAPGSIQPHGVLFALGGPDLRITAVSENAGAALGVSAAALLDQPLGQVLDPAWHAAITAAIDAALAARAEAADAPIRLAAMPLVAGAPGAWRATLHATAAGMLLEAERPAAIAGETDAALFDRFERAAGRLQAAADLPSLCARLAGAVRRLTGYDRVKVYRFAADWSGEVIAEDRDPAMPAYLGLHFPASDIPAQARALYVRHPERQIPDAGYIPVPVLRCRPAPPDADAPDTDAPDTDALDLGAVGLRSVSPRHVAYLHAMAVGASMSISILRQGVLWGLVACHHRTPRATAPELRQACVLLARLAAWQIGAIEAAQIARHDRDVQAVGARLLREAAGGGDGREVLLRHGAALLDLLGAGGMALASGGALTTLGRTPDEAALRDLLAWLAAHGQVRGQGPGPGPGGAGSGHGQGGGLQTDHLAASYPSGAGLAEATGLLAVPLGGVARDFMLWFRPERIRSVAWAGDPAKPGPEMQPNPRRSFAVWRETVRGRAEPWLAHEVAAAQALRDMVVDIIARRALELERMNLRLARSNADLEAFAYVAAHDLKEPLRQIEVFGTLLERAFRRLSVPVTPPAAHGTPAHRLAADKTACWFTGIQTSARRLRALIDDLARYARLGQHANPPVPTDLNRLLELVLLDFAASIEAAAATIESDALPTLHCDATQLRQVLQNLISNALKYRHPARPPALRIAAARRRLGEHAAVSEIRVTDNGIGFDERHRERIFEPFERLHSHDAIEGSGIGLAICRKVMARHGGSITARSCPGEGSEFTLRLPATPPPAALPMPGLR